MKSGMLDAALIALLLLPIVCLTSCSPVGPYAVGAIAAALGGGKDDKKPPATPPALIADFTASPTHGTSPLSVQFSDASTGGPTSWEWDFNNDGTPDSSESNPSHEYSATGWHTVKLTVSNSRDSHARTREMYIHVANGIYYVDGNMAGSGDGTSWAQAFKTIQEGLNAAGDYDLVLVADGTYRGASNIELDFAGRAICLKAEEYHSFGEWIIDCESNGRGFHFQSGEGYDAVVDGFTIQNGYVTSADGGGVLCQNTSYPTIRNCVIRNCGAGSGSGGGISCQDSAPIITNCIVTNNNTTGSGGGVCCTGDPAPVIINCRISDNSAQSGGGVFCDAGIVMANCVVSGNEADGYGGGICCPFRWSVHTTIPTITKCVIEGNSAGYCGGGISCEYNSGPTVANCLVKNNSAGRFGAGLYCDDDDIIIVNCTIAGNSAGRQGNSILYPGDDWGNASAAEQQAFHLINQERVLAGLPEFKWADMLYEVAKGHAGDMCDRGFYSHINPEGEGPDDRARAGHAGTYTFSPCIPDPFPVMPENITMGQTDVQSVIDVWMAGEEDRANILHPNCTRVAVGCCDGCGTHWVATFGTYPLPFGGAGAGGGIYCAPTGSITVNNTIIWGNTAAYGIDIYANLYYTETLTLNHCCYSSEPGRVEGPSLFVKNNCVSADPQYTGAGSGNYRLSSSSPCIEAGNNTYVPVGIITDLDGGTRIQNGTVDIGAYEYSDSPVSPRAGFTALPTRGPVRLTVEFGDLSTGSVSSWSWDFGDGGISTEQNPSHTYVNPGIYTVKLTVTGPGGWSQKTKTGYIVVDKPPVADFVVSQSVPYPGHTVNFIEASIGDTTSWAWDFENDGTVDSTEQNPSHTYSTAGWYTVKLTASGPKGDSVCVKKMYVLMPNNIWYVDASMASSGNGWSWGQAFKTIQEGLAASGDHHLILVADGTYTGASNRDLSFAGSSIYLKAENRHDTGTWVIDCQDSGRGFLFNSSETSDAVLDGFTIQNGRIVGENGGGIACSGASPTVRNCVIRNCKTEGDDTGGAGISCYDATPAITNCAITDNDAQTFGGAIYSELSNATIEGCMITDNTAGIYGGGIYYHDSKFPKSPITCCTISNNSVGNEGGGVYPGGDPGDGSASEQELFNLINQERNQAGLPNLKWAGSPHEMSRAHANDMCDRGYYSHMNPEGEGPSDRGRLGHAGSYTFAPSVPDTWPVIGENIIMGHSKAESVVEVWMTSEADKANILHPKCTHVGVGICSGCGRHWVAQFGSYPLPSGGAGAGGGIFCEDDGVILYNTIIWGNTAEYGADIYTDFYSMGNMAIYCCCYAAGPGNVDGFGDITVYNCVNPAPLFLNAGAADYRLQGTSICIDAGHNLLVPGHLLNDLAGNVRIVNDVVDIGVYEHQEP